MVGHSMERLSIILKVSLRGPGLAGLLKLAKNPSPGSPLEESQAVDCFERPDFDCIHFRE